MARVRCGVTVLVFSFILLLAIGPVNAACLNGCSNFAWGDNIRLHISITPAFMVSGQQVPVVVTSEEGTPKGTAVPCGPSAMWGTGCYADNDYFSPTDSVKFKLTATGGALKDTVMTTDMSGKAVTTFTAGQQPGSFLIAVEGISWGSKKSMLGPGQTFTHPPKASTYVSIAPPVTGSGNWDVSEFAVVLYADPSLLHLNEVGQVITQVFYKGYPDQGRKVELQWDGGNLDAGTGLTNSEGKFITNFSSPEKGIFTIIAKSQRLGQNLEDTAILNLPVIPLPGGGSWGLSPPVANFSVNRTEGDVPLTVQFQDTSGGGKDLLHWRWDFGDRGISFEQNPVHTYTTPGTYSVSLMVENQAARNATVKNDLITVHQQSFAVQILNFVSSIPAIFSSLLGAGNPSGSGVPVPTPPPTRLSGENAPCDDGNPCTVDDYYRGEYCMSGRKLFCSDNNPQTIDWCDPDVGCVFRSRETLPDRSPAPTLPCDPASVCGDACVDLDSDPGNCGLCGRVCELHMQCVQGICRYPVTSEGERCGAGFIPCAGYCIDPAADPANCGGCGMRCGAGQICMRGLCRSQCQEGYIFCSGTCVDPAADPANCGGCGMRCTGKDICEGGACRSLLSCESGLTSCAGTCADILADPANCGGCGMVCGAGQICMRGLCRSQCQEGYTFCSGSCINLQTDRNHCGRCGNACIRNMVCEGGGCIIPPECDQGFTYCSGQCMDTQTDPLNCGGCGITCHRGEICVGGACRQW